MFCGQIIRLLLTEPQPNQHRPSTDKIDFFNVPNILWANYQTTTFQPLTEPQPNRHQLPIDFTDKVDLTEPT
jgi:hypothetical protein